MDAETFLRSQTHRPPEIGEWLFALLKLILGLVVVWCVTPICPPHQPLIQGWVGMVGIVFVLHFGLFHLLSCGWRACGLTATPLMNWPIASANLAEFWGNRWNRAFRDLTHRFLFRPLAKRMGPTSALLIGFLVSGLIHDIVISGPCGAGWGLPTLYFLLQGFGLTLLHSRLGRNLGLRQGWSGRIFCCLFVIAPAPLLFHPPFVKLVILPFLHALRALS